MTTRTVTTEAGTYVVADDRTIVVGALVVGRVTDELTNAPPLPPVTIAATVRRLADPPDGARFQGYATVASGGRYALSGTATLAFPDLAATDYEVMIEAGADGYLGERAAVVVPAGTTGFPLHAPPIALHRPAVELRARLLDTAAVPPGPPAAIQHVTVAHPPGLVGLEAGLTGRHGPGAAVEPVQLVPTGAQTGLLRDAAVSATSVAVLSRSTVAPGTAITISSAHQSEDAIVAGLAGPADPARPGTVLLEAPLRRHHRRAGTTVAVHTVAVSPGTALTSPAAPGDRCIVVADPTTLPDGQPCRLGGAAAGAELGSTVRLERDMDPDGHVAIGPVGRADRIRIDILPAAVSRHLIVDYDRPTNFAELRI